MFPFLNRLFDAVGSVLFVQLCPICNKRTESAFGEVRPVCDDCMRRLPRTEQAVLRNNSTEDHFYHHSRFVRGGSYLFYEKQSDVQMLVEKFKYANQPQIAYQLAREAAMEWMQSDFFEDIDVIVPIPLHKRRLRQRGYNQSEYIARALHDVTGIPLSVDNLQRLRNNPKQALKKGKERRDNVRDIFFVKYPELFINKHVLLVDDIVTTGSTMLSCMDAMQPCRRCQISVFSLAKPK